VAGSWWLLAGGWWLVAIGWWLVAGGWWLLAGGWWLVTPQIVTRTVDNKLYKLTLNCIFLM